MKILVADNSKLIRKIIRVELESGGYEVLEAEDAGSVYSTLEKKPLNLIALGVEMPGQSGYEICAKILGE